MSFRSSFKSHSFRVTLYEKGRDNGIIPEKEKGYANCLCKLGLERRGFVHEKWVNKLYMETGWY